MGTLMNKDDFHIPFIKSMVLIAFVTVFSIVSSRYIVNYYSNQSLKTTEYSSNKSQISSVYGK